MSKCISGKELPEKLDLETFELFDLVKAGLQPYTHTGKPLPPPDQQQKKEHLRKLQSQRRNLKRQLKHYMDDFTPGAREAAEKFKEHVALHSFTLRRTGLPRGRGADDIMEPDAEKARSTKRELEQVERQIASLKAKVDKPSWKNYDLPDLEAERKRALEELVDAFYLKEDVQKLSGPPQRSETKAPSPIENKESEVEEPKSKLRPSTRVKKEVQKIAKELWDTHDTQIRSITEMDSRPELAEIGREYQPRTRRRWLSEVAPPHAKQSGKRPKISK